MFSSGFLLLQVQQQPSTRDKQDGPALSQSSPLTTATGKAAFPWLQNRVLTETSSFLEQPWWVHTFKWAEIILLNNPPLGPSQRTQAKSSVWTVTYDQAALEQCYERVFCGQEGEHLGVETDVFIVKTLLGVITLV